MKDHHASNVTQFRLTKEAAKKKINATARLSDNVIVDDCVYEWGARHAVFDAHVFEILRNGDLFDEPVQNGLGDWECTMTYKLRGRSDAYAATVVICAGENRGRLYLKKVGWEYSS